MGKNSHLEIGTQQYEANASGDASGIPVVAKPGTRPGSSEIQRRINPRPLPEGSLSRVLRNDRVVRHLRRVGLTEQGTPLRERAVVMQEPGWGKTLGVVLLVQSAASLEVFRVLEVGAVTFGEM